MSVEINSNKLDEIKQAIVDGIKEKLTLNNDTLNEQVLTGNVLITSTLMKDADHICINCSVTLTNQAINDYGAKEPVDVDNKHTKKTHKADKE